ncbi:MAG: UDP-3-O-(3-hydroxymyristoyl)glucosamine N-acyltransferase [Synergistaceae bacterium]|nr:UDP-3-O-(3-hydroxymyristoyl)glucosamine N-acyltransferase [Synergistota bacterium]NLM71139.1 UDP-3-O-(3-hydroxymyristoyl)glucosamine N-acyltransferase [Synergistaceae bacterium]
MKDKLTLRAVASAVGGSPVGEGTRVVAGVASPDNASKGEIVCLWGSPGAGGKKRDSAQEPKKGVLYLADEEFFALNVGCEGVVVEDPKRAFSLLLSLFERPPRSAFGSSGVHPTSSVAEDARVHPSAWVGPGCVVEGGAVVGKGAFLHGRVFVGEDCVVGPGTVIEPGAVLLARVRTGVRCLIHCNAAIGCDGFGVPMTPDGGRPEKVPQLGGVVLGDEVEVGACTTIDRGTLDDTVIGSGTKIDNQVQIGHNAVIGENCIIVAQTGISGSAVLEDGVVMAARSGVKEHACVGKGAIVAAQGGVIKDVPPGEIVSGFPARPHRENFRLQAALQRVPDLLSRVKELEKRLKEPESAEGTGKGE